MDFLEDPPFPACPSFGFTSEPLYRVTVVTTAGGHERRNRHWARPLHRYTASVGPRAEAEVSEVLHFYHAVGGRAYGFRFKDWVDYKSCDPDDEVTVLDQVLSPIDGSDYQMMKYYTAGVLTQQREITKPVDGTISVADNGVVKTEGVDWVLDYTTGIVTISFSPVGVLTWGGEFHVPVRFDSELPVEIVSRNVQRRIEACTFSLMELRLNSLGTES